MKSRKMITAIAFIELETTGIIAWANKSSSNDTILNLDRGNAIQTIEGLNKYLDKSLLNHF